MKIIIFGATGMVGRGVLRECLSDTRITEVLVVGRTPLNQVHPKLRELIHTDLWHYSDLETKFFRFDACFYCLGVSSTGMTEKAYSRITFDATLAAAKTMARLNNSMVFVYVSGSGTDSSQSGKTMWARVKGKTENALTRLSFKAVYSFRPAFIQPLHGFKSKTRSYRIIYSVLWPVIPILRRLFPRSILTTEQIGQAMIEVARNGYVKQILEPKDIFAAARAFSGKA